MAHDLSYTDALEQAAERPPQVILGPAPCKSCGAWVEWAGVEWLALGTDEPHDCAPFLRELSDALEVEVVAARTRPTTGLPAVRMAHPAPEPLPTWVVVLGPVLMLVAGLLAAAAVGAWLARHLAG